MISNFNSDYNLDSSFHVAYCIHKFWGFGGGHLLGCHSDYLPCTALSLFSKIYFKEDEMLRNMGREITPTAKQLLLNNILKCYIMSNPFFHSNRWLATSLFIASAKVYGRAKNKYSPSLLSFVIQKLKFLGRLSGFLVMVRVLQRHIKTVFFFFFQKHKTMF